MTGASTRLRDWNDGADAVPSNYTPDSLEFQRDLRVLLDELDAESKRAAMFEEANERIHYRLWAAEVERDAARAECEAHKARADRYDTEAACASILRAEVERVREALSTAERRLESGALRIAELGDARAAYGLKEWAADARAALAGAPRHD